MMQFFTDLGRFEFLQYALLTGLLASVACGVVGTYVVVRRITYLAGGIAHSVLGGMGLALYLNKVYGWTFLHPFHGAVAAGIFSALLIGMVSLKARQREDTVIGAIWAIGMAVGILFIAKTPGFDQNLMSYLFGNILIVSPKELWLIAGLDLIVVVIAFVYYHHFTAVCFDEEFARLRGVNVEFFYLLLLVLTALTVVLLVSVVGIIMVIALLTLPVAMAANFSRTLWHTMLLAIVLSMAMTSGGLAFSYGADLPSGATIIVLAGFAYLVSIPLKHLWERYKRANGSSV
ncbi:MAG TPA: metal ABC transporter permease [bacterium]|nr:metal ABC transporter permease [bacterium]